MRANPAVDKPFEVPATVGGATTQVVIAGSLGSYRDDAGEFDVTADGLKALEENFAIGGCAQMWLASKASREAQFGLTTTAVSPAVGVPVATQRVALIKGTKKANTGQKFINWLGDNDAQVLRLQKTLGISCVIFPEDTSLIHFLTSARRAGLAVPRGRL